MSYYLKIKGYPKHYFLLIGQSYLFEHNADTTEAGKFEEQCGTIVRSYENLSSFDSSKNGKKEFIQYGQKYENELKKLETKFIRGCSLFNNLAIFNLVFYELLKEVDPDIQENYHLPQYLDRAKYYISKAMEIVEQKLVTVEYGEISEAVLSNYIKIIEENSD